LGVLVVGLALRQGAGEAQEGGRLSPEAAVPLGRLSVSSLRPGVGQEVWVEVPYAGPFPADPAWEGVSEERGTLARLITEAPGPVTVRAFGFSVTLAVQPGANRGPLPNPKAPARALPFVSEPCDDPRLPQLSGLWAIGCDGEPLSRAEHILSGEQVSLEGAPVRPGLGGGVVYGAGPKDHGLWRPPSVVSSPEAHRVTEAGVAPPGTDGLTGALSVADALWVFELEGRLRESLRARPAPWMPPAVDGPVGGLGGCLARPGSSVRTSTSGTRTGERARRWCVGRAASATSRRRMGFVGWIEDAAVCVESLASGERRCVPASPGPSRRLSLWGAVACWEDYGGDDIDVVCSDGLALRRPGHQHNPSRIGPWLLFREGNQTLLAQAEWIVLDDDDLRAASFGATLADPLALRGARAEGGARYTLSLPPGEYTVERRVGEAWTPGETVEGGAAADRGPPRRRRPPEARAMTPQRERRRRAARRVRRPGAARSLVFTFDPSPAVSPDAIPRAARGLAGASIWILAATGLGGAILGSSSLAGALFLGSGVLGLGLFGLAWVGLFSGPALGGVAVAASCGWLLRPKIELPKLDAAGWAVVLVCGAPALINALAPPTDTDEIYQHLAIPSQLLHVRGLLGGLLHPDASRPIPVHTLYAAAMSFGGEPAPKLLHLLWAAVGLHHLRGLGDRWLGAPAGGAAALTLLGSFTFARELGLAYNNLPAAWWGLLAVEAAVEGRRKELAAYAGMALACKYTAAPVVVAAYLITWRSLGVRAVPTMAALTAGALAWVAPYWLRNASEGLHPLFPYAGWPEAEGIVFTYNERYGLGRDWASMLLLPWNMVVHAETTSYKFLGQVSPAGLLAIPGMALGGVEPTGGAAGAGGGSGGLRRLGLGAALAALPAPGGAAAGPRRGRGGGDAAVLGPGGLGDRRGAGAPGELGALARADGARGGRGRRRHPAGEPAQGAGAGLGRHRIHQ
jgi:hypothetical protein